MKERFLGSLLGLACGDAVGTTVEFRPRGTFRPVSDMLGGGPFGLEPGQWTDDTSMALCLAVSLLERQGFDPGDLMERFVRWKNTGYLSSNGTCFDIGNTIAGALRRFEKTGQPYSGSTDPRSAGNGSIMRLAPVPMYFVKSLEETARYSAASSKTTHGTAEAVDACRLFGVMIAKALLGKTKEEILFDHLDLPFKVGSLTPRIQEMALGGYQKKLEGDIRGSGYVVHSLEAALWCFNNTANYRRAVLKAVNLGEDADTTAAVCGQLAGAFYGRQAIPETWLSKLAHRDLIEGLAHRLYEERRHPTSPSEPAS